MHVTTAEREVRHEAFWVFSLVRCMVRCTVQINVYNRIYTRTLTHTHIHELRNEVIRDLYPNLVLFSLSAVSGDIGQSESL